LACKWNIAIYTSNVDNNWKPNARSTAWNSLSALSEQYNTILQKEHGTEYNGAESRSTILAESWLN